MTLDLDDFIEFGTILNREERGLIADYLSKVVDGIHPQVSIYSTIEPYRKQIDDIFSDKVLLETVHNQPEIARQVSQEIITLFQTSRREYRVSNPYAEEESAVDNWTRMPAEIIIQKSQELFVDIRKRYSDEEFPLGFYEKQFKGDFRDLLKNKGKGEALVESILADWSSRVTEKEMKYEMNLIDKARAEYCKQLYKRIDEFRKLIEALSPFTNELGRLWDLSTGLWRRTNLDILKRYSDFLEHEQSIKDLAEMLGRFDAAESDLQEEEITKKVFETEWKLEHAAKAELVGVHESDDLNNLIPTELAFLADHTTEIQFYKKFAEKKLMSWEYQSMMFSEKETTITERAKTPKKKEKGPIIICVDTSGSMHGVPETIAKTVAFAILRIALRDKRACYLISFSTSIMTLKLNALQESLEQLIEFLGMSFYGGTDPEPALREALVQMEREQYRNADVLVVSDFIMDSLSKKMVNDIEEAKKRNNKFHSLVLSSSANQSTLATFDHNWFYDLNGRSRLKELVGKIREISF